MNSRLEIKIKSMTHESVILGVTNWAPRSSNILQNKLLWLRLERLYLSKGVGQRSSGRRWRQVTSKNNLHGLIQRTRRRPFTEFRRRTWKVGNYGKKYFGIVRNGIIYESIALLYNFIIARVHFYTMRSELKSGF